MRNIMLDTGIHDDARIGALRHRQGPLAIFAYLLALIDLARDTHQHNASMELTHEPRRYAELMHLEEQRVVQMMRAMVEVDLFQHHRGRVFCLSLARRTMRYGTGSKPLRDLLRELEARDWTYSELQAWCDQHPLSPYSIAPWRCLFPQECLPLDIVKP